MIAPNLCEYCGEAGGIWVEEVYREERTFALGACCETAHLEAVEHANQLAETQAGRRALGRWFQAQTGIPARAVVADEGGLAYGNGGLTVDHGLRQVPVTLKQAKAFVGEHHRHTRPPCGWRFGFGLANGRDLVAVVMVGRPVARMIDHTTTVEVNRLCRRDLPVDLLAWNACSMLYGAAAREARRRGFERIVTYTLESERGTTLRAAGWDREALTKGGSWNRPSRSREDKAPTCRKVRWSRTLSRGRS